MAIDRSVTIHLNAVTRRFSRGMKQAVRDTNATSTSMAALGKVGKAAFLGVAVGAAAAGFAVAKGLSASISSFAEFDAKLTQSQAIMGELTDVQMAAMSDAAREIATTTRFSAAEAAESFFFLASAGFDAEQSMAALPEVAAFAQAGMFDMALATDLLTDAQSALGLSVDDTQKNMANLRKVSDVLVKANTLANASVQQFSESLTTKAGAALKIVNKDIEEGVAVLAAFADQGVKGADAGTGLSIVLRDLSTKAIKNADEFERFDIAVFNAEGNMNNLGVIIGDVEDAIGGMSDAQAKATLLQLGFTDKSVTFIQTLLGTSEAIMQYEADLRTAAGTTQEVADNQLDTLTEKFGLLKDTVKDVFIGFGEEGDSDLKQFIDLATIAVEAIADMTAEMEAFGGPLEFMLNAVEELAQFAALAAGNEELLDFLQVLEEIRLGTLAGADNVDQFANAIQHLASRGTLTEASIRGIGKALKLTDREMLLGLGAVNDRAAAAKNLEEAQRQLDDALRFGKNENLIRRLEDQVAAYGAAAAAGSGYALTLETQIELEERAALEGRTFLGVLDEEGRAMGDLGSETEITAGFIGLFGDETGEAATETWSLAGALAAAAENQQTFAEATRETLDPTFKAVKAVGRLRAAQERHDKVMGDSASSAAEQTEAFFDLLEAELAADDALLRFGPTAEEQIQGIADVTGRAEEEVRALFEAAGLLDGTVINWKFVLDASQARETLAELDALFADMDIPFIPRKDIEIGDIATKAHGGSFNIGQPTIVGERGPELVIPQHQDMVFSNADTRRLLTGGQTGDQHITFVTSGNIAQDAQIASIMLANRSLVRGGIRGGAS